MSRPTPPPPDEPMLDEPVGWVDPYDVTNRRRWAALGLLLIFTAIVFASTLQSALVWGDDVAITDNPAIRSIRAVIWTAAHPRATQTLYHPLADVLLWLQYHRWLDWNPSGYHIISLALHLLNTTLFWLILRRLRLRGMILGAALFALHPLATQPVVWISQQPMLWATMFSLLAVLIDVRLTDVRANPPIVEEIDEAPRLLDRIVLLRILLTLAIAAALMCDVTVAAVLPVVLIVLRWWRGGRIGRNDAADLIAAIVLTILALVTAAYVAPALRMPEFSGRLAFRIEALGLGTLWHLSAIVDPWPLRFAYRGGRDLPIIVPILADLIIAAALVLLWLGRDRPRVRGAFVALLLFVVTLVPQLLILRPPQASWIFDSQQYLPRAAVFALIAHAIGCALCAPEEASIARRSAFPVVVVMIVASLTPLTFLAGKTYADDRALWSNVVRHDPDLLLARAQLARALSDEGEPQAAQVQFQRLVELDPGNAGAHMRLADVLLQLNRTDEAIAQLRKAVELRPNDPGTHRQLASALAKTDPAGAEAEFKSAIALDPTDDVARHNYATFLANTGRANEAIAQYKDAIAANPASAMSHLHLASLLFATGQFDAAAEHLNRAQQLDPNNYEAYMTAGWMLMNLKDFANAARMFNHAATLQSDRTMRSRTQQAQALNALGVALQAQGQTAEAIYNFSRALDVLPDYEKSDPASVLRREVKHNLDLAAGKEAGASTRK